MSREFTVANEYHYNRKSTLRWIISHVLRYRWFALIYTIAVIVAWLAYSQARVVVGQAATEIVTPTASNGLLRISLIAIALLVTDSVCMLISGIAAENIAARFEADARQELYISLLGKNQAFHDRQRVGDIMSRATDDVSKLGEMISPGTSFIFEMILGIVVPITFIGLINLEMTLIPLIFIATYIVLVRRYLAKLNPVIAEQRAQSGKVNATLEETISGIEVVKASAREHLERTKFRHATQTFRDLFVQQGRIEARYLPLLIFGITFGLTFLHAMFSYQNGRLSIADIIGIMSLVSLLRFPTFISSFALSLVRTGISSAERILAIIQGHTDLDENVNGYSAPIQGRITFENVVFGYDAKPILQDISFDVQVGQTIAIVGQTGSGKSALTQLVNRTYDVQAGKVLIDNVDVRDWNLDALRSQIAKIEQDVFLFSRSIRENIAFGAPNASEEQIIAAAKSAQAHDFISTFSEGYDTEIGERGVTLSGGQRQRIALARAFLNNPRILILDDSTSAIDSATEDEIQKAIRHAQAGRTTLLITHRLSQIRWADIIIVIDQGRIVAQGDHEQLLRTSAHYRRIFARYDTALPPLELALG